MALFDSVLNLINKQPKDAPTGIRSEREAKLKDKDKNPTGYHRCWASINHEDDELWKVSKEIFESDIVRFNGDRALVEWNENRGCWQPKPIFGNPTVEVIGNVWETPELLK